MYALYSHYAKYSNIPTASQSNSENQEKKKYENCGTKAHRRPLRQPKYIKNVWNANLNFNLLHDSNYSKFVEHAACTAMASCVRGATMSEWVNVRQERLVKSNIAKFYLLPPQSNINSLHILQQIKFYCLHVWSRIMIVIIIIIIRELWWSRQVTKFFLSVAFMAMQKLQIYKFSLAHGAHSLATHMRRCVCRSAALVFADQAPTRTSYFEKRKKKILIFRRQSNEAANSLSAFAQIKWVKRNFSRKMREKWMRMNGSYLLFNIK